MPNYDMLMQDPMFQNAVMQALAQRKKKKLPDMLKGMGSVAALGKQLPKLQAMQEQWKIQDAERKAKKLKLDFLTKQAEAIANQQQQAQMMSQARNSV